MEIEGSLYCFNNNLITLIPLSTFKPRMLRIPSDYLIQDILSISMSRLIINGAKRVEEGYKEHSIYIYDGNNMTEIDSHKFGIVGFKMVFHEDKLYFLSDKKCQVFDMLNERYLTIPSMLSTHIDPGCCSFNNGILVIGGLNNRDVDLYRVDLGAWVNVGKLDFDIFSVSCVQIYSDVVLIVSCEEFFKYDVGAGKVLHRGMLPGKYKAKKVGNLTLRDNEVYCVFGPSTVVKYSISSNKWKKVVKIEGCCLVF